MTSETNDEVKILQHQGQARLYPQDGRNALLQGGLRSQRQGRHPQTLDLLGIQSSQGLVQSGAVQGCACLMKDIRGDGS